MHARLGTAKREKHTPDGVVTPKKSHHHHYPHHHNPHRGSNKTNNNHHKDGLIIRRMVERDSSSSCSSNDSGSDANNDDDNNAPDDQRRRSKGKWETVIVPRRGGAEAAASSSSSACYPLSIARRFAYEVTVYFPSEAMPFLIGIGGRNLALISRHAAVTLHMNQDSVTITQRRNHQNHNNRHNHHHNNNNNSRKHQKMSAAGIKASDVELAHKLVVSSCTGGFVRWFSRMVDTEALVPQEKLRELDRLVKEHHNSSMKLLQASTGHMCLVIVPNSIVDAESNVADARKAVLEHLLQEKGGCCSNRGGAGATVAVSESSLSESSSSSSSSSTTVAATTTDEALVSVTVVVSE